MKPVCRVALALFVPVAALAAETIAFERYQTIIDRQPFGQPPPGFNPSQMASEVQKGVAAAAEVELTVEQQELQKVVVFSKNVVRDVFAGLKTLVGGEIAGYTEMLNDARNIAIERMENQAGIIGADAIVNVRFATASVMAGSAEIIAYGTAVKIKK